MKAIVVTDQAAGTAGMKLVERPEPEGAALAGLAGANYGDVVQVHASGFTWDELSWPSTWTDRLGRDRTPSIPGHELAGVVTALSYGTTGLSVGQRVFGLTDWVRDGTLADYVAVEARKLLALGVPLEPPLRRLGASGLGQRLIARHGRHLVAGDDLHDVAVPELRAQRLLIAIDFDAGAAVADRRVHGVGKIQRRRPLRQRD